MGLELRNPLVGLLHMESECGLTVDDRPAASGLDHETTAKVALGPADPMPILWAGTHLHPVQAGSGVSTLPQPLDQRSKPINMLQTQPAKPGDEPTRKPINFMFFEGIIVARPHRCWIVSNLCVERRPLEVAEGRYGRCGYSTRVWSGRV